MAVKVKCPNCGRILGDTDRSIDGLTLNCRGCKKAVNIRLKVAEKDAFYSNLSTKKSKGENDDKS